MVWMHDEAGARSVARRSKPTSSEHRSAQRSQTPKYSLDYWHASQVGSSSKHSLGVVMPNTSPALACSSFFNSATGCKTFLLMCEALSCMSPPAENTTPSGFLFISSVL